MMKIRSLNRSVTVVCISFFAVLCIVLSAATWKIYTATMYERYQKQMVSVLDYVQAHIDTEDMAVCARTYEESETYRQFQAFFDDMIDHYSDVHFLYIMQALDPEAPIKVREICAANSTYEKENEPDMVLHLGDGEESWYDTETAREIRAIQDGAEDVFFLNPSEWGVDYTLARPLIDAAGWHYAILCVDVSVDELNHALYRNIYINIAVIILAGILFTALLIYWMRRSVIRPLKQLEKSVTDFAGISDGRHDAEELRYQAPALKVRNEVYSLSTAMSKLAEDMRAYIKGMTAAEDQTRGLQAQVFQDSLTKVKNKAAYDEKAEALDGEIRSGNAEFGIVMADLNNLKGINDRYGHDRGNEYIIGACKHLCAVFSHSPVYRIGGDEFVVVLQGEDYRNREALFAALKARYAACAKDEAAAPWDRYSAALGMSVCRPGDSFEAVFERADRAMYEEKKRMKAGRGSAK